MNDYWLILLAMALVLMNLSSFFLYRHDKMAAKKGAWRTSENSLLLAALLGPFGAFAAMRRYRHKTKHLKFILVPLFMVLWIAVAGYLVYLQYFA
ncbi:MAG: DUF1294 domain-containing protein [Methanomassiliicoccales archaeon]